MNFKSLCLGLVSLTACISFAAPFNAAREAEFVRENTEFAVRQTQNLLTVVGKPGPNNYPRTLTAQGRTTVTSMYDWTPGFFPGSLWYLYELTGDNTWRVRAEAWTAPLEKLKTFTGHHDIGFMMYCSYGNAERLASRPAYQGILIQSARSLCTRFSKTTKTIRSWNQRRAWSGNMWHYPVIIDNMMNLELLCYAARVSGDKKLLDIALTHADTTLKNHFRPDGSSYHVVNYDSKTGEVLNRQTCQGYADNSTWARGQAWAIYGYTMMYRETRRPEYLEAACRFADFYLSQLPEDLIPLWDFNAGQPGYLPDGKSNAKKFMDRAKAPRDVSAAAVVCSALFELGGLAKKPAYTEKAIAILKSMASPAYRAELGGNGGFLLMHSTGSIPHNNEIDKPLVYADYYFLEALTRYRRYISTRR